jgi:hypothetical protein
MPLENRVFWIFGLRVTGSWFAPVLGHGSTGLGRKTPWQVENRLLAVIHGGSDLQKVRVWLTGPRTARVLPSRVKRVAGHDTWAPPKIVGFGSAGDDPAPPTSNRKPEGSDYSPAPSGLPTRIHRIRSSLPLPSLISLSTSLDLSLSRHSLGLISLFVTTPFFFFFYTNIKRVIAMARLRVAQPTYGTCPITCT